MGELDRQFALTEISLRVATADRSSETFSVIDEANTVLAKYPRCGLTVDELCAEFHRVSAGRSKNFESLAPPLDVQETSRIPDDSQS